MGHYLGEMRDRDYTPTWWEKLGFISLTTPGLMACKKCSVVLHGWNEEHFRKHREECNG